MNTKTYVKKLLVVKYKFYCEDYYTFYMLI